MYVFGCASFLLNKMIPRTVHVGYKVDSVSMGQNFPKHLFCSQQLPHPCSIFTHQSGLAALPRGSVSTN